jgi:FkbM family methyltransferase
LASQRIGFLEKFKQTTLAWELRRARAFVLPRSKAERAQLDFYSSVIPSSDGVIVDVGANMGTKVEIFRHFAGKVIAFEPDSQSADLLRRRFAWRRNVEVRECAVSDRTGFLEFYSFQPGSAFNTANIDWVKSLESGVNHMGLRLQSPSVVKVSAVRLSDITSELANIKYLKVDAEGHEAEVIATLDRPIPLISLEFNLPEALAGLKKSVSLIESVGVYEFNAVVTEPPASFELDWVNGVQLLEAIEARGWRYVEVYARLRA